MTLTDFLLARITEDETNARDAANYFPDDGPFVRWDSDRVLAECEAKRRMVEGLDRDVWHIDGGYVYVDFVLSHIALPYADHPEYDPAWRPQE